MIFCFGVLLFIIGKFLLDVKGTDYNNPKLWNKYDLIGSYMAFFGMFFIIVSCILFLWKTAS